MPNRPNFLKFSTSQDRDRFAAIEETISRMSPRPAVIRYV